MRMRSPRVVAVAALATLSTVLLSGCELREGDSGEYGSSSRMNSEKPLSWQLVEENSGRPDVRQS
jgi:hypothetical protein